MAVSKRLSKRRKKELPQRESIVLFVTKFTVHSSAYTSLHLGLHSKLVAQQHALSDNLQMSQDINALTAQSNKRPPKLRYQTQQKKHHQQHHEQLRQQHQQNLVELSSLREQQLHQQMQHQHGSSSNVHSSSGMYIQQQQHHQHQNSERNRDGEAQSQQSARNRAATSMSAVWGSPEELQGGKGGHAFRRAHGNGS